jgi:hypothetical protein
MGHERMKGFLLGESPLAFRRRFIFTEAEPLRRASMPRDGRWWAYETIRSGLAPFAGGMADNLLQAQPDDTLAWSAHRAAMENGFERRMNGIRWTQPGDQETIDVMRYLSQGPVAALTGAELKATAQYLDGDPGLACSAAIKKSRNLMAMPDGDAARASRSLMANTARIDIVKVISRICRELNDGWSCA